MYLSLAIGQRYIESENLFIISRQGGGNSLADAQIACITGVGNCSCLFLRADRVRVIVSTRHRESGRNSILGHDIAGAGRQTCDSGSLALLELEDRFAFSVKGIVAEGFVDRIIAILQRHGDIKFLIRIRRQVADHSLGDIQCTGVTGVGVVQGDSLGLQRSGSLAGPGRVAQSIISNIIFAAFGGGNGGAIGQVGDGPGVGQIIIGFLDVSIGRLKNDGGLKTGISSFDLEIRRDLSRSDAAEGLLDLDGSQLVLIGIGDLIIFIYLKDGTGDRGLIATDHRVVFSLFLRRSNACALDYKVAG